MKYKLKRQLPWAEVGTEHTGEKQSDGWYWIYITGLHSVSISPQAFSDWFEEVDERWKPNMGSVYWIVDTCFEPTTVHWGGDNEDKRWNKLGNCFKTKEEAERAAEQIKALLKEFHKNNP